MLREPAALALTSDDARLLVANRKSGTISVVELAVGRVVGETKVAEQLSALVPLGRGFVAADEAAHELVRLELRETKTHVVQRLRVAQFPVGLAASPSGKQLCAASLWSRRLTLYDVAADGALAQRAVIDLDFAPRKLLWMRDEDRLLAADAFGGQLAVIDAKGARVIGIRTIPGHHIRGLGVSANGKMLVISHQMLNDLAHSVQNDVHWGLLMSNDLRWLDLEAVLSGEGDLFRGAHMHPLGEAGRGTGDPAGLAVAADGTVVVAIGGVSEIAIGQEHDFSLDRRSTGKRPVEVAVRADGSVAYVANQFSDSITVVDVAERKAAAEIPLGPMPDLSLAEQGKRLFYDAALSHDGWMSCHSCHTDGHTNGSMNDNFSDGSFGAPKRILSLLAPAGTAPFAWNGKVSELPVQIRNSLEKTMQADQSPAPDQVAAIAAFLETLAPPPGLSAARETVDEVAAGRGERLFGQLGCAKCHAPPAYTTPDVYDVGLHDKLGNTHFNPPSLRGVSQRGPYFHDNRANSLRDVFREYAHQLERELTDAELQDLLEFLNRL